MARDDLEHLLERRLAELQADGFAVAGRQRRLASRRGRRLRVDFLHQLARRLVRGAFGEHRRQYLPRGLGFVLVEGGARFDDGGRVAALGLDLAQPGAGAVVDGIDRQHAAEILGRKNDLAGLQRALGLVHQARGGVVARTQEGRPVDRVVRFGRQRFLVLGQAGAHLVPGHQRVAFLVGALGRAACQQQWKQQQAKALNPGSHHQSNTPILSCCRCSSGR